MPGLRKEELAFLAGLSTDHYSRIEQGRQQILSDDVLDSLASALALDDVERAHLRNLAAPTRKRIAHTAQHPQRADAGLLSLMTALDRVPVLLLGRRWQVLARNTLLSAVLDTPLPAGSSFARWLFLDPDARRRITNWAAAAVAVGALRYELGRHPDDSVLNALIEELRETDPAVARWWDDHRVTDRGSVTKVIDHPVAGALAFGIESVVGPHDLEQRLVVYTVERDSPTARALPLLGSWGSTDTSDRLPN